ncbi:discoidin domain-containing protein [Streptomyces sp. NPDC057509]|uniref:discoidin domain-containing protein n=1 Tax=Streptomyces sp. NPDC057509 TaxID=3346152 RepID=UPI003676000F
MGLTRRTFLQAALSAGAVGAVGGAQTALAGPASAAGSPPGDVVGKVTVGYQGWFACKGDGAPIDGWWHWTQDWGRSPSPSNTGIKCWPDPREYTHTYPTAYGSLGNGQPATLFSSYDQQTVDTHFRWMREYGIDTAALQRFNPTGGEGPTRDAMAAKVRSAAESNEVKFYVMYDVTNWDGMRSEIKADWTGKMKAHTASPQYATQNGLPVVCVWGFGFNDTNHPFSAEECLDVINWFKAQGCYVIGGVPREWRTGGAGSRTGYADVYHAFDMISPWMIGAIGSAQDADNAYTTYTLGDEADCAAHGIDYQPCVLPGDVSARQRAHGDFMWRQFYNMCRAGVQGIYISMFDEYNEGNQIAKTAESSAWTPVDSGFLALDEDGTACSSDYYLRLTGDGGRMLKGLIALTPVRPTPPTADSAGDSDLALRRPTAESSRTQGYGSGNAVDGDPDSYWESANDAFPQWIQVDLGAATAVRRIVLTLPPSSAWAARTQTVSVQGSADGGSFGQLLAAANRTFDPATGNSVTLTLPTTVTPRFVRLTFTANSGWPAAQLSGFEVHSD